MDKPRIDNILASRYATAEMCTLWDLPSRIRLERELWIAVMKAQRELGVDIPAEAIEAYENVIDDIRPERIAERERTLRHDVKSRIEEFCALAGYQHIHKGMTSRDLTDNVEQLQVRRSLELVRDRTVACLAQLRHNAEKYRDRVLAGRTHNVAAQPTTLGRRLAMYGEELLVAFERLESLIESYPLRGIVGAVGTATDQQTLLGGVDQVQELNRRVRAHLGFAAQLECTGQVYPRSLDYAALSTLYQLVAAPGNFARTLRLMAGAELAHEGFQKGQVGSSAMPHKINARSCERINALVAVVGGYVNMAAALVGDQWNEGDVSCSVVRRVALPDCMFAVDGLLETFLVVQHEFVVHDAMIENELDRFLPFLASTRLLMEAVQRGAGREEAHEVIKEHAVAVAREMRENGAGNELVARLGADTAFPLSAGEITALLKEREAFVGAAREQVDSFTTRVIPVTERYAEAAVYTPGRIL